MDQKQLFFTGIQVSLPHQKGLLEQRQVFQSVEGRALNLVTNLVVLWNPAYLQQVVQTLRAEGVEVRDEDLTHFSPAHFEHLNRLGKCTFPRSVEVQPNGLRLLRPPS